jgi:hypothetical protein
MKQVRQAVLPGNPSSIWKAIKNANDANLNALPNLIFHNQTEINPHSLAEMFDDPFNKKI